MISSLVRWFGRRARRGRSGRRAGSARRFTPQLEALEDRAVPGGVDFGVPSAALLGAEVGGPSYTIQSGTGSGSKPGGAGDGVSSAALHGAKDDGPSDVILLGRKPSVINV